MIKSLTFDFCEMHIYESYLIVTINDGIHLSPDKNEVLAEIAEIYYNNKQFVYITHRKNSYSVDPAIYIQTSRIKNLCGFAVVAGVSLAKGNAEIEKLFLKKPFEIFSTTDDAVNWAKRITQSASST